MTRTRTAALLACVLSLAPASFGQPATHVVRAAYVIAKGQTAKPKASAATDWNNHMARINQHFSAQYNTHKDMVVEIIEGSTGAAGGANGTVKMTGGFWNTAYNAYINQPQTLIQSMVAFPHEFGHALGLDHSLDTKSCLAKKGVDMGDLRNLIMQQTGDAGNVLLTDTTYHADCLGTLGGRPHPTTYLTRTSMQAPPAIGWNVNLVDMVGANGAKIGAYRQVAANTWVEQNAQGMSLFNFTEPARDDWSVYLYDASRITQRSIPSPKDL